METLLKKIEENSRLKESEPRATDLWNGVKKVLDRILPQYERVLGIPQKDILEAIESKRTYWAVNFYQDSRWPDLAGDVMVFENQKDLMDKVKERKFRCPCCKAVSTDPYTCDSGAEMEKGKVCDWESFGLFRTLGKGLRFTIKDMFLKNPTVDEIFMPLAFEKEAA